MTDAEMGGAESPEAWLELEHSLLDGLFDFDLGKASKAMGNHRQALRYHEAAMAARMKTLPAVHFGMIPMP